jgi:hypothetical protein
MKAAPKTTDELLVNYSRRFPFDSRISWVHFFSAAPGHDTNAKSFSRANKLSPNQLESALRLCSLVKGILNLLQELLHGRQRSVPSGSALFEPGS